MSILVLGGEGMLGHKMFQTLAARFAGTRCTIFGSLDEPFYRRVPLFDPRWTIPSVNVLELLRLHELLEKERPDFIVNCIGIIKQRDEEKNAIPCITLNSLLPHLLAEWAEGWKGRLIHFSTDCVFSGKEGNYSEDSPSDAEDLYGKTKFLGEVACPNALTIRTSIIGRELAHFQSLLEWFLAQDGKKVRGFRRVIYSGVTTNYLADLVGDLITDHQNLSGLYQVTAPAISKYGLLCRIRDAYGISVDIVPDDSVISDRSMNGGRFRQVTAYPQPSWDDLIQQLASDKTPYDKWQKEIKNV